MALAGWMNWHQQDAIAYLKEETRMTTKIMSAIIGMAAVLGAWAAFAVAGEVTPTSHASEDTGLVLADKGGPETVLVATGNNASMKRTVETWAAFLKDRGFDVQVVPPSEKPELPQAGPVMAFETEAACPLAKKNGIDLAELKDARDESHVIVVREWKGRPCVLVIGKTPVGANCGSQRLLSLVRASAQSVTCPALREVRKPFFNVREVHLCPCEYAGKELNFESWDRDRLERYPRFLLACGLNSVQFGENLTYWGHASATREKIAPVLRTIAKSAHNQGMTVSQFIWGGELAEKGVYDAKTGVLRFSWGDSCKVADESKLKELFEPAGMAKTYGDVVDHIITHWGDPGSKDPTASGKITMSLLNEYRKYNPKVRATISTWSYGGYWGPGAKRDKSFAPQEIGIALQRWYDKDQASVVLRDGRRLGIWAWYLCDEECTNGDLLYTRVIDKYFSSLSQEASAQVDWLSVDKCRHGALSRVNQFVAGQKMWDPMRPLREIMMDYCGAMYGRQLAAVMCNAMECEEQSREQSTDGSFIPESDRFPEVWNDAAFAKRLDSVLKALREVKLPERWRPNLPDVGDVSYDVKTLQGRLSGVRDRLNAWDALVQAMKSGDAKVVKALCTSEGYASLWADPDEARKSAGETLKPLGGSWSKGTWSRWSRWSAVLWSEVGMGQEADGAKFRLYRVPLNRATDKDKGKKPWIEFVKTGDRWLLSKWTPKE
jgi:hypothetical protein